jgi:molecular chaperone HscA
MAAGMARLEVTFKVDADGLLTVSAKELTTGIEQHVEVTPSYGLTDAEVEQMLLDALDHGEEDMQNRQLAERKVEGERIVQATLGALERDGDLLDGDERAAVQTALDELRQALAAAKSARIQACIDELDAATKDWAGRRMDRAIGKAIAGKVIDEVDASVAHARGVDAHVDEHARRR